MIQIILTITLRSNLKFRTLEKENKIRAEIIEAHNESPSHVTIRNWTLKIGYYELTRPKDYANDWIIILDHSIQFGQQKIFVVLGIRKKDYLKLKRPLQYTDLETLQEVPMLRSNGELIYERIKKLQEEIGIIIYAVGDYGSDLKKGLRLLNVPHIHDLSHLIARTTEKIYKNDTRYIEFKKAMSLMRNKFAQTNIASIVPPKGRKKSEYQSFDKIVKWSEMSLNLLNNTLKDTEKRKKLEKEFGGVVLTKIEKELSWLIDYADLINELSEISIAVKAIEKDMKHSGLSAITLKNAEVLLTKLESENGSKLGKNLLLKLKEQFNLLLDEDIILCSSDILESTFGKYKNRVSENPMASVTVLMLMIAAFTSNLTEDKIKESMENVKISDIKEWEEKKIGTSLHKQRILLLSG